MKQDEVRAFDALAKHPKLSELVTLTREMAEAAVLARSPSAASTEHTSKRAEELGVTAENAATEFGNALAVLERGPQDDAERALARGLFAHAIAEDPPGDRDDEDKLAGDALWLGIHTAFDATCLFDRALGEEASEVWRAVADRVRKIDQGKLASLGRGEGLLGCAALAASSSDVAQKLVTQLAGEVVDPAMAGILSSRAAAPTERLRGELTSAPRGPVLTALLGFTGMLFVANGLRLLARLALAYRSPAEVTMTAESVRIQAKTLLLGRTLREREIVLSRASLARAMREVRYPRLALYAGLLALAVGTYVGVLAFVDGVRAASPSLLLMGVVAVVAGIGLDFALASLVPGTRGRCNVLFVPRTGSSVCIRDVDVKSADAAMARLAQRST